MNFDRMLDYLRQLEVHNDRSWFHDPENYQLYTAAKQDFTDLVEELKLRIADVTTPDLAERLIFVAPKALLYRVPRDMRTNKGKPPYNPRWAADLSAGRNVPLPLGYYVHIQPGDQSLFGFGIWPWDKQVTPLVRAYLDRHWETLDELVEDAGYPLLGDKLKRVPQGFDPLHPGGEYLKYKDWFVARSWTDTELKRSERFLDQCAEAAERMEPMRQFFQRALAGWRPEGTLR